MKLIKRRQQIKQPRVSLAKEKALLEKAMDRLGIVTKNWRQIAKERAMKYD